MEGAPLLPRRRGRRGRTAEQARAAAAGRRRAGSRLQSRRELVPVAGPDRAAHLGPHSPTPPPAASLRAPALFPVQPQQRVLLARGASRSPRPRNHDSSSARPAAAEENSRRGAKSSASLLGEPLAAALGTRSGVGARLSSPSGGQMAPGNPATRASPRPPCRRRRRPEGEARRDLSCSRRGGAQRHSCFQFAQRRSRRGRGGRGGERERAGRFQAGL